MGLWQRHLDQATGCYFLYNPSTGQLSASFRAVLTIRFEHYTCCNICNLGESLWEEDKYAVLTGAEDTNSAVKSSGASFELMRSSGEVLGTYISTLHRYQCQQSLRGWLLIYCNNFR